GGRNDGRDRAGPQAGNEGAVSPRASDDGAGARRGARRRAPALLIDGPRGREERRPRDARASVHPDGRRSGAPRRADGRRGTVRRVSDRVGLVRCPDARIYDHGSGHPLRPDRVLLTWDLVHAYGLDEQANVATLDCAPADDPTLELIHTPAFIDATRGAGHGEQGDWARFGYGPGDNPIFDRMHEAGALVAGASVAAARAVWTEGSDHAFNAAGGLHHAMPDRASGFCVYNDPAIAIAWLLANGCERIAYVDVDVHHGDGVQFAFWNEARV